MFQPIRREGEAAPIGSEEESGVEWEREFVWEREREGRKKEKKKEIKKYSKNSELFRDILEL